VDPFNGSSLHGILRLHARLKFDEKNLENKFECVASGRQYHSLVVGIEFLLRLRKENK